MEYSAAYQNGYWNGLVFLLDKKGNFNSGLLPKVRDWLNERGEVFTETDKRSAVIPSIPIDLTKKLQALKMVPRDYQERTLEAIKNNERGIIRSCTGSGKSLVAALATALLGKSTTVYVIGIDLIKQFHDLFSALFDEPIGFIGNGVCDIQRINIASIWSIGCALKVKPKNILLASEDNEDEKEVSETNAQKIVKMLAETKIHIFDESHVVATDTITHIYWNINPERIYGFSGTPFRDDNTDLLINGILGEQIINVSASELISKGVLAQPIIKFLPVPKQSVGGNDIYQTVYRDYIVENDVRNTMIIEQTQMLLDKKYTPLVLFKQIKHGQILLEKMQTVGIKCKMLYGEDTLEQRTEVKRMLLDKEIQVILASTIFDLGIDIPMLSGLVLCGGGRSSIKTLQRVGRVIRGYKGKKIAAVVDFYDQCKFLKKHSEIRCKIYSSEKGFNVIKCKGLK